MSRRLTWIAGLLGGACLAGGGAPAGEDECPEGGTALSWQGFAGPFFDRHCNRCHEWTYPFVTGQQVDILQQLRVGNMPPFEHILPEDIDRLAEWLACGAPEASLGTLNQRGDANQDGDANIADSIRILEYLFSSNATISCLDAADVDGGGSIELTDAVYLLQFLFLSGPPPPDPFGVCGSLPRMGCSFYDGCHAKQGGDK